MLVTNKFYFVLLCNTILNLS